MLSFSLTSPPQLLRRVPTGKVEGSTYNAYNVYYLPQIAADAPIFWGCGPLLLRHALENCYLAGARACPELFQCVSGSFVSVSVPLLGRPEYWKNEACIYTTSDRLCIFSRATFFHHSNTAKQTKLRKEAVLMHDDIL